MYCPYCGNRLGDADNFCSSCGRRRPVLLEPLESVRQVFEGALVATAVSDADADGAAQGAGAVEGQGLPVEEGAGEPVPAAAEAAGDAEAPQGEPEGEGPAPAGASEPQGQPGAPEAGALVVEADAAADLEEPPAGSPDGGGAPSDGPAEEAPGPESARGGQPAGAVPAAAPAREAAPAAVRRAAPFIASQVPDPDALPGEGPRAPYLPWGTPLTAACMAAACALAVAAALLVALLPLFEFPALPAVEGAPADAMAAALASADARMSAFLGGLLGAGGVGAWEAARAAAMACDAVGDPALAVEVGLAAGAVLLAVCALVAGAASSLALRRASPLLVAGSLCSCAVLAALAAGSAWLGDEAVSLMRAAASETFAGMGAQMPASFTVLEPAPALVAAAACSGASFALAAAARHAWKTEHPAWGH